MKALIIDKTHRVLIDNLIAQGIEVDERISYNREDLLREIENYNCIVIRSKILIDKEIIDRAKNLKCIARQGAGMDAIDTEYAEKKGIKCLCSPEGNRNAVGEHALGMLLMLFNKLNIADHQVRQYLWQRESLRGEEIEGKTIGIIGYGNMGGSFARKLSGFSANVIAYDKYKSGFSDNYVKEVSLETLFKETDILSLHTPLTEETHFMVDYNFLSSFSKPIYLINTSRGKVLKTSDLLLKLKEKKVLGACLDVLEYEDFTSYLQNDIPQEIKEIFQMENVVFSPHIAGLTKQSYYKLADILSKKIINCLL
ncbi:MAG: hypothetical protein LBM25_04820 [Bacteroidales bacterium]|jgi:D-3-phosphoglycerate dehydrogenase|nr:hypothetical protein [Bacteroidales bacterium]